MKPNGWFGITFSSKLKNGMYVASIDLPFAYDRIEEITVLSCTGYNNYSELTLECDTFLSQYSRNTILVRTSNADASGISANVNLNIIYK